jgi:hypothetical protein
MEKMPEGYFSNIYVAATICSYLLKKFDFLDIILWGSIMAYSGKSELLNCKISDNPVHYIHNLASKSSLTFPVSPSEHSLDFSERPVHDYYFYYYNKNLLSKKKICEYQIRAEEIESVFEIYDKSGFCFWLKQGDGHSCFKISYAEPFMNLTLARGSEYCYNNPYYRSYTSKLSGPPIF